MNKKEYYARSENCNGEMQTVEEHIREVRSLCETFVKDEMGLSMVGKVLGTYHDFGKTSNMFQKVLEHKETHVDHSISGSALLAYINIVGPNKKKGSDFVYHNCDWTKSPAWPLICAIRNHHGEIDWYCDEEIKQYMQGKINVVSSNKKVAFSWKSKEREEALEYYVERELFEKEPLFFPKWLDSSKNRELMLYTRMLFSALVDADYASAARHMDSAYLEYSSVSSFDPEMSWNKLCSLRETILEKVKADGKENLPINKARNQVFEECTKAGKNSSNGIYTMTAPTGAAKTFGMAAFALQQLMREENPLKKRVIVVLPFHSIIEQNADVFRKFIPEVIEIYSQAETNREISGNFDASFIVTTSVQFFEALFACNGPKCRKLHRFANSVIIFDECQTLPSSLAGETITVLRLLAEQYHATVLFSSGTQPRFEYLSDYQEISGWSPKEIISNVKDMFLETKRVFVDWKLGTSINLDVLINELLEKQDVCMIVNLRRHASKIYHLLEYKLGTRENLYLLSANMPPAQRKDILEDVKKKREQGDSCILVATQCLEAGIDISFPFVYRALAPLEAIVQAAGRCNRHGEYGMGNLVVFRLEEENEKVNYPSTYYEIAARTTEAVFIKSQKNLDICDETMIQKYFQLLFGRSVSNGKNDLKKAIEEMDFVKVQAFYKLIPDTAVNVIVPYNEKIFSELEEEARNGINSIWIKKATPYMVSVYNKELVKSLCEQLFISKSNNRKIYVPYYLCSDRKLFDGEREGLLLNKADEVYDF